MSATRPVHASKYHSPNRFLVSRSRMTRKLQRWVLPPLGARTAASRIVVTTSSDTGSEVKLRIARWVYMASCRDIFCIKSLPTP